MDPTTLIQDLCARFGLKIEHGENLRPLIERALGAPQPLRDRILKLVEGNLERIAHYRERRDASKEELVNLKVLGIVARILHNWEPPSWLLEWDGQLENLRDLKDLPDLGIGYEVDQLDPDSDESHDPPAA